MRRSIIYLIFILLITLSSIGCNYSNGVKVDYKENSRPGHMSASFKYFDGENYSYMNLKKDEVVKVDCSIKKEEGKIEILIIDSDGNEIWSTDKDEKKEIHVPKDDKYKICLIATEARGSYSIDIRSLLL
ncbi:MAG: hypothetical protein ACRC2K_00290 [Clostridium sp.]